MTEEVLAVVKDLFFVARIRETARLTGTSVEFCRSPEELNTYLGSGRIPNLVILDLTTPGWDYEALFARLEAHPFRRAILAFTTHALARTTQRWHARCDRVVTKETLTQELPDLLTHGVTVRREA
jgi:CheY-like chemotaxis protein